jgi:hypothetical protein
MQDSFPLMRAAQIAQKLKSFFLITNLKNLLGFRDGFKTHFHPRVFVNGPILSSVDT